MPMPYDYVVSNEAIEFQINDKVVTDLEKLFGKLIDITKNYGNSYRTAIRYFKSKETKSIIDDIDKVISKRFGITFKHVSAEGIGYAVFPSPPTNINVVAGDVNDKMFALEDALNGTPEHKIKVPNDLVDFYKDQKSIISAVYKSHEAIEKTLNSKGVKLDLKKATISGLPSDYIMVVMVDLSQMLSGLKMTTREMVSVLLHEVGHSFTHVENSYRTVKTTTVLLDTLRTNIAKGKSPKAVLNIAYKQVVDADADLSKSSDTVIAYKLLTDVARKTYAIKDNDQHSFTDSEQLADQFSNRFGLGAELVSSLGRMNIFKPSINPILSTTIKIVGTALLLLFGSVISLAIISIAIFIGEGNGINATTYDDVTMRYKRIRNDVIRLLRNSNIANKDYKNLIAQVEQMDGFIKRDENRNKDYFDKLLANLTPGLRRQTTLQESEELIEALTENTLYVAAAKLKGL